MSTGCRLLGCRRPLQVAMARPVLNLLSRLTDLVCAFLQGKKGGRAPARKPAAKKAGGGGAKGRAAAKATATPVAVPSGSVGLTPGSNAFSALAAGARSAGSAATAARPPRPLSAKTPGSAGASLARALDGTPATGARGGAWAGGLGCSLHAASGCSMGCCRPDARAQCDK